MFAKSAEDVQGKLVGSVFDLLFTPAAFFWLAGFIAWGTGDIARFGRLVIDLTKLTDLKLLVLTAAVLALIVLSGAAYEPMNGWLLQRLAGYWGAFDFAGAPFRAILRRRVLAALTFQQQLLARQIAPDPERRAIVEATLHYLPDPDNVMISEFGCALVASDRRISAKYGLSSDVCWAALSYVVPDAARKAVADARSAIEASGRLIFWTFASLVWIAAAPRWPSVGVIVAAVALISTFGYFRLAQQGREYGDAFEAAFDIGRASLYKSLRFPLPPNNGVEPKYGATLTSLLYRGLPASGINFTDP